MKRTTLVLDERQFAELKKLAAEERKTLSVVTEEVIRAGLSSRKRRKPKKVAPLPKFDMGRAKVDIADRIALYKVMEGR